MSDTQPTRASQNSNTAEYVVVACLFAGLAGALAYGMYISQPDMPPAPGRVGAVPAAAATAARADANANAQVASQAVKVAADGGAFTPRRPRHPRHAHG